MYENLAVLTAFVFLYSIVSGRLEQTPFSGAIVFTAFGLLFGPLCLGVLTLVRMLPVFLSLAGMGLRSREKLFIGWFGPRGLASIVFVVIVLNEHLPGGKTMALTVVCTIILSIIAHGLSAHPLINALVKSK